MKKCEENIINIIIKPLLLTVMLFIISFPSEIDAAQTNYEIGQPGSTELELGIGKPVCMGSAFTADPESGIWYDSTKVEYQRSYFGESRPIEIRNGLRAATLGGTGLVLWDEDSEISLFNYGNTAGMINLEKSTRIDTGAKYSSTERLAIVKPGSEYQGAKFWMNDSWTGNAFLLAEIPGPYTFLYGGVRTAFRLAENTALGLRFDLFGISKGSEQIPSRGAEYACQVSGAHRFHGIWRDDWALDVGASYTYATREKYDLEAVLVGDQDLQIGMSAHYSDDASITDDNALIGLVRAKNRIVKADNYQITIGADFAAWKIGPLDDEFLVSAGWGVRAWKWLLITMRGDVMRGSSAGLPLRYGLEIRPFSMFDFRCGYEPRKFLLGIGLRWPENVNLDIKYMSMGDLGNSTSLGLKIIL